MQRKDWLTKKHQELHDEIEQLDREFAIWNSAKVESLITDLKKQKLNIKTELLTYGADIH